MQDVAVDRQTRGGEYASYHGFSTTRLYHKGRNKYHFEYWIDYNHEDRPHLTSMKMPVKYVVEMFIDRIAPPRSTAARITTHQNHWNTTTAKKIIMSFTKTPGH